MSSSSKTQNVEDFLRKEVKSIQKQFMKAKGELYELNFKNNALKAKVEKTKRENQVFKNKLKESYKN